MSRFAFLGSSALSAASLLTAAFSITAASSLTACGDDEESGAGSEGAACYGNGTCDEGLDCNRNKICVGPGSGSTGGVDLDACFSCGENECPNEANACRDSEGCAELLECTLDCAADASCAASCDTSQVMQDDVTNMAAFTTCIARSCATECTPDVGPTPGTPGPGTPGPGTPDLEACLTCSEDACPSQLSACRGSAGCAELFECAVDCAADANCAASCDTSQLMEEGLTNLSALTTCISTSCATECVPDEGSTPGTPSPGMPPITPGVPTPTGMSCTTEGDRTGSCATDSLMVCTGGQWVTDACLICGVVTPESQCVDVRLVTLEERGTAEMSDLVGIPNPEMEIVADGSSLRAEWYLDANQMGVLQFEFSQGIDPGRIEIQGPGSAVQYVTLETPGGASGCQYTLSGGRLVRYHKTTGGNIDWYGCWGDFETLTTSEPTTTTIMNVRTPISQINELRTMSVSSVIL